MRMIAKIVACTALLAIPVSAIAKIPSDLADLIGIRASSLDSEMAVRSYKYVKSKGLTQYWWNAKSGACVWAVTDNGIISSIQSATPGECGQAARKATAAPAAAKGAPAAAQKACKMRNDQLWGVPKGSSVVVDTFNYGQGNYELTVTSGDMTAKCSVNARGVVSDLLPQ